MIPKQIFQTWITRELPPNMNNCVEKLKLDNPEFKHILFDDNECEQYMKNNFSNFEGYNIYQTYLNLIPGAFKADLWRYCVLYREGGIYLDIKFECVNGFKFIDFIDKNYFSRNLKSNLGIYNAIMITIAHNDDLKKAILKIYENVNNNYYGNRDLEPTGPLLLKSIINKDVDFNFCSYKNKQIIREYNEYRDEQKKYDSKFHYGILWIIKQIYVVEIPKIIFYVENTLSNKKNQKNYIVFNKNICNNYIFKTCNFDICDDFVKNNFSKNIYINYKYIEKHDQFYRTIICKYCILYIYGGIFINNDIKLKINFDNIIEPNYEYILFTDKNKYVNNIMIFKKNHKLIKTLIKKYIIYFFKKNNIDVYNLFHKVIKKNINYILSKYHKNIIPLKNIIY